LAIPGPREGGRGGRVCARCPPRPGDGTPPSARASSLVDAPARESNLDNQSGLGNLSSRDCSTHASHLISAGNLRDTDDPPTQSEHSAPVAASHPAHAPDHPL